MPPNNANLLVADGPKTVEGKKTFLHAAHPRAPPLATKGVKATADADLTSWYGQQIPFSSIVASGALAKSGTSYEQAGGFTKGVFHSSFRKRGFLFTPLSQAGMTVATLR